jgi:hypothetical protein
MIDERLNSANTFAIHQNKLAKQAEDYIRGISDKEGLEKAIAEWWKKYRTGEVGYLDKSVSEDSDPEHTFFEGYILSIRPELRGAIVDLLRDPGRADGIEKDAAGRLFGRVIATELAKNEPDMEQMNLAFSCFEVVTQFWSSFKESFEKALADREETKDKWVASLANMPSTTDISAYFIRMNDPDLSEMEFEQTEWENTDNPFYVWNPRPFFYPRKFISFVPLEILYRLDFKAWIESLENLPLPHLKELAITDSDLERDPQAILKLIRESSTVFDEQGKWSEERRTAALYGVTAAFGFAENLFKVVNENDPDSLTDLKERELPEWFQNAFEAVLQRPDGEIISAGFLAWLIREHVGELIRVHERGEESEWSLTGCAVDIVAEKLAENTTWEVMQTVWKFQKENVRDSGENLLEQGLPVLQSNSLQYYLGGVLTDEFRDDSGDQSAQKLWDWFTDLLRKRDRFIDYICNPHLPGALNWVSYNIGRILSHISDPLKEFSKTWDLLQHQRNRVFHQMPSNDIAACYPSQLLIRVGIGAILWTVDKPDEKNMGSDSAKELWFVLFDSAYQMWAMKTIDVNSSCFRLLQQCIGVVPLLFKDVENPVRKMIGFFKTDSKMICSIVWLLWKNGLPIDKVDSFLRESGVSIRDSVEEEVELAELSGSEKDMMPLYTELKDVIGSNCLMAEA